MAGKLKNCSVCGKLFSDTGRGICYDCLVKQQDKEKEVIDYVRSHRMATVPEIVAETGASETLVKRLIREGRFEQIGVKLTYPCEKCGEPIIMGKLCQSCQQAIRSDLQETQSKMVAAKNASMQSKGLFTTHSIERSRSN